MTPPTSRLPALAAILALHGLALLLAWRMAPQQDKRPAPPMMTLVWLPAPAAKRLPPPPPPPVPARSSTLPRAAMLPPATLTPPAPAPDSAPRELRANALEAPPQAANLHALALQSAGKADSLERGGKLSDGKLSAANAALSKAISNAVKNKYGLATEITEVSDGSGFGDRVYKVKGPFGTVCARVDGNHPHRGNDAFRSSPPLIFVTNCT